MGTTLNIIFWLVGAGGIYLILRFAIKEANNLPKKKKKRWEPK